MSLPASHPTAAALADYHARRLPPTEVLAVSDHLAGCAACREALARLQPPPADDADDGEPAYEEMAALLDGTLTPERAASVRVRLERFPRAADEFDDLRAFRDETAARPLAVHGPPSTATGRNPGKIIAFPGWTKAALSVAAAVLLCAVWWRLGQKQPDGVTRLATEKTLAALPADLRRRVEEAARTGRLDTPPLPPEVQAHAGTLAGEASAPTTLAQTSPVNAVVRELRPRLRWNGRPDATSYVVYLAASGADEPLYRQELPANRTDWPPPAPLARGTVYEWQVEARKGDEVIDRAPRPPAPESRFQVMNADAAAELETIERQNPGNPLVLGAAYERAGLRDAAAGQFRELAQQYPQSTVAERLKHAAETAAATTR